MVRPMQNGRAGSARSGKRNRGSLARRKSEHRRSAEPGAAVSRHCYSDDGVVQEWNRGSAASRGDASTCDSKVYRARCRGQLIGKMKSAAVKARRGDKIRLSKIDPDDTGGMSK